MKEDNGKDALKKIYGSAKKKGDPADLCIVVDEPKEIVKEN
jgi:hypothetical protein